MANGYTNSMGDNGTIGEQANRYAELLATALRDTGPEVIKTGQHARNEPAAERTVYSRWPYVAMGDCIRVWVVPTSLGMALHVEHGEWYVRVTVGDPEDPVTAARAVRNLLLY